MTQSGLGDFAGGNERPAAEAHAVAGNESTTANVVDADTDWLPESQGTIELAVTQVDYTIDGSGDEEEPIIHVFGRTPDDEQQHVRVVGFRPYFYAPTETLGRRETRTTDESPGPRRATRASVASG